MSAEDVAVRRDDVLPCPVGVVAVDLEQPIAAITECARFRTLRMLVRLDRQPLGWVTIREPGDTVTADRIRTQLVHQLPAALRTAALRRLLAPRRPAPSTPLPPVSVVVCTRDRTASLTRCLDSLAAVGYPVFEVIVVDNAPSTSATAELTAGLRAKFPVSRPLRYVREDCPGLDWARNRGIAEARHEIVAFTDDDVRVDAHWLLHLGQAFADPATMLVTGLVAPAELDTEAQLMFEHAYGGMGKGLTAKSWQRDTLTEGQIIGSHHLGVGANMAFRRPIFERVGTFDTALDVGTPSHGGGDLDMFHRVLVSGAVVRYEPKALVWHSHRRDPPALARQLYDNGRAFGVYLLTCARHGGVPRGALARYTTSVWLAWLGRRLLRRIGGRGALPMALQLAELRGVAHAPFAAIATRRSDRRLRRQWAVGGSAASRFPGPGSPTAATESSEPPATRRR